MSRVELTVIGISNSQSQSGAFALILGEKEGTKRIPIIIGAYEAQAIALELENMHPNRPLTHDLFMKFFDKFDIELDEVFINRFSEGIFYSQIICKKDNEFFVIDSRTSDAIALAVRAKVSIFCDAEVIEQTAIPFEVQEKDEDITLEEEEDNDDLANLSVEELQELLEDAIGKEDYELAGVIRDLLNKKQ